MPFERYLHPGQQPPPPIDTNSHEYPRQQYYSPSPTADSPTFSSNVQFQVPQLMLGPTLAPGGGAEVLPAGMIALPSSLSHSWFANSGQTSSPTSIYQSSAHSHAHYPPSSSSYLTSSPSSYHPSKQSLSPYSPSSPAPASSLYPLPSLSRLSHDQFPSSSSAPNMPPLSVPAPFGLPVYSSSGFDLLTILNRVATRPHPKILLGPVDMSCSFVLVDKRRFDSPIVYASPTFCKLTGYSEQEVIGTNCRFLQAPHGRVKKGDHRKYTAPEAVAHLRNSLIADKECQTSMINYRKGGAAFINLVTVIPIPGGIYDSPEEADQIAFHVGFQVDLTEQPNAILQKLRDGTYAVNYSTNANVNPSTALSTSLPSSSSVYARDWRTNSANMSGASKEMKKLLSDPSFMNSLPISTSSTTLPSSSPSNERSDMYDGNKLLNLLLLEAAPDFVHVVSLKGDFLYVAPSVRRVLGYEPEDLVGKSLTHICHDADIVPLTRELKESSSTPHDIASTTSPSAPSTSASTSTPPKTVDLLFRVRPKNYGLSGQDYVWLECRGRLHVEPGKGRKAIILSGRVRSLPVLDWGAVSRAFAISPHSLRAKEFWALLSPMGSFLFVGANVKDFLGWGAGEVIGKSIYDFLDDSIPHPHETPRRRLQESISLAFHDHERDIRSLECLMRRKPANGRRDSNEPPTSRVRVQVVLFHPKGSVPPILPGSAASPQSPPKPLVCYFRTLDASSSSSISGAMGSPPRSTRPIRAGPEDVFEELRAERGSSWQYELQQLKIANQKLMDEVEELETSLEDDKRRTSQHHESTPARRFSSYDIGLGIGRSDWGSGLPVAQSQSLASLSLKRSWDASAGDPNAT